MKILYEDKYILAVFKEAGVPSQDDNSGHKSLCEEADEYTHSKTYIITRLDRPVKGIVLFAKDKFSADKLTKMVQSHTISKTYHAVVCGKAPKEGHIETYLMKDSRLNISKTVNKGTKGAKLAILNYTLIEEKDNMSKIEIDLVTGRHHQIRAQFASVGLPLYGDVKYNPQFKHKRNVTPALCACKLVFTHPFTNETINIETDDELDFI